MKMSKNIHFELSPEEVNKAIRFFLNCEFNLDLEEVELLKTAEIRRISDGSMTINTTAETEL